MHYCYILECADGTYYTGYTTDLEKRLKAHNEGNNGAKYTRSRRPCRLVFSEGFETKTEALSREWHVKRLSRLEKEKLIEAKRKETSDC